MPLSITPVQGIAAAGVDGVSIPVSDLVAFGAAELGDSANSVESKFVLGVIEQYLTEVSSLAFTPLGIAATRGTPTTPSQGLTNQPYSVTLTKMVNLETNVVSQLPEPTTGTLTGVGGLSVLDIFPNATKVAAIDNVTDSVVVSSAYLNGFGAPTHAALTIGATDDNRSWFEALFLAIATDSIVRSTTNASALITASRGNAGGTAPSPAFTQSTNPTTGISAVDLPKRLFFTYTDSFSLQFSSDIAAETFNVNVATA